MIKAVLLLGAVSVSVGADTTGLPELIETVLYPMMDQDSSGGINQAEFVAFGKKIDLCQADETGSYKECCDQTFGVSSQAEAAAHVITTYDVDGDNALSKAELESVAGLSRRRELVGNTLVYRKSADVIARRKLQSSETCFENMVLEKTRALFDRGGEEGVVGELAKLNLAPAEVAAAKAYAATVFKVVAAVISSGDANAMKGLFAIAMGVDVSACTLKLVSDTAAANSRRLAVKEYTVTITAYFPDEDAADAAMDDSTALDTFKTSLVAEMGPSGITVDADSIEVTSAPVPGQSPLPVGQFGQAAMILAFLGISCGLAGCISGSKAKKAGVSGGCCEAGCCSYFAIKGWAGAKLISAIVLLVACLMLFNQMNTFTNAVLSILEGMLDILALEGADIERITRDFAAYKSSLDLIAEYITLLPIAAIVPGLLAAIFLLLASVCGFATSGSSYCCAKIPIFFSYILLLLCIVLYLILTGVSVAMYLPETQEQLRQATSICDSAVPDLANLRINLMDGIEMATTAGMAVSQELKDQVTMLEGAVAAFDSICEAFATDLIIAIEGLLFPCIFGLVATLWSFFNTFGLCCAEGCFSAPKHAGGKLKVSPEA